jgi:putative ABC transport system ATP-binding protein
MLQSVTRTFGAGDDLTKALDEVSIRVDAGSTVALVGPSGSGKTTLLNLIAALDFPTEGTVKVGTDVTSDLSGPKLQRFRNEVVGVVFQQFFLIEHLSVLDNVLVPLIPRRLKTGDKVKLAMEALRRVGLVGKARRHPSELSGGELQRVAVARGIVGNPMIILADEPTGNLDLKRGEDIMGLLAAESEERGKTVVIATHDTRILGGVDGIVYLNDGKVERLEGRAFKG